MVNYGALDSRRMHGKLNGDSDSASVAIAHFPTEVHGQSYLAAIAAECAAERRRFAEYHRRLVENMGMLWKGRLVELAGIGHDPGLCTCKMAGITTAKMVSFDPSDRLKAAILAFDH